MFIGNKHTDFVFRWEDLSHRSLLGGVVIQLIKFVSPNALAALMLVVTNN